MVSYEVWIDLTLGIHITEECSGGDLQRRHSQLLEDLDLGNQRESHQRQLNDQNQTLPQSNEDCYEHDDNEEGAETTEAKEHGLANYPWGNMTEPCPAH